MILGDIYLAGLTIAKAKQIKLTGKNLYNTYDERIDILIYYHIVKSNIILFFYFIKDRTIKHTGKNYYFYFTLIDATLSILKTGIHKKNLPIFRIIGRSSVG